MSYKNNISTHFFTINCLNRLFLRCKMFVIYIVVFIRKYNIPALKINAFLFQRLKFYLVFYCISNRIWIYSAIKVKIGNMIFNQ